MYDFKPDPAAPKDQLYQDLAQAVDGLTAGEDDSVANMANVAALLWQYLPDVNWTGFYRAVGDTLVLGPFAGKPACLRISFGQGVCGTAAMAKATQLVQDVEAFAGHIACDGDTRSEVVVPVLRGGKVIAVIDCDSPSIARFDTDDAAGLERVAAILSDRI